MANTTIPNLPVVTSLTGVEYLEAVQSGTSVRVTVNQINSVPFPVPILLPQYTTAQKNAIITSVGAVVYDTTLGKMCVYTPTGWQTVSST